MCFVETSGLLVVISHSGYCCKFSIEFEEETPVNDLRTKRYNNRKRIGSRSPIRHTVKLKLKSAEESANPLSQSTALDQSDQGNLNLNNQIDLALNEI